MPIMNMTGGPGGAQAKKVNNTTTPAQLAAAQRAAAQKQAQAAAAAKARGTLPSMTNTHAAELGVTGERPALKPKPAPTQTKQFPMPGPTAAQMSAGGAGGGGGGVGAPAINPDVDYLQEAGYMATVSALDRALQDFEAQDTAERGRYDVDYKAGLRDLGYRDENIDDEIAGQWDWNDVLTASGRGYQNNLNDFASRGMLESQGYFDSLKNLERSLGDQLGSMGTGRQNFKKERDEGLTNFKNQDKAAKDAARISAIERLSASLGLV